MTPEAPLKNIDSTTSFDDLPHETASDIFLRLPVKTLARSTSVNKTWYSLITNPSFISDQIHRALSHCNENDVLIVPALLYQQTHCSLVSADTSSVVENFEVPFNTRSRSLKLVASVNGLLLLTDSHMHYAARDLYLWNPCVRRYRGLVSSCFKKLLDDRDHCYYIVGLGFHKESNDYRVVRIVYVQDDKGEQFGEVAPKVEIYSMRKHTWRKIKDAVVPRLASENGVYLNGSYYWLEIKPGEVRNAKSKELWMLSFDFGNEVFGEMKLPDEIPNCTGDYARFRLMVFEGSLSVCVFGVEEVIGVVVHPYFIWLMRNDDGLMSWTLRFRAFLREGGWPMNITKSGRLIVETYPSGRLDVTSILSCNLTTMDYKDLGSGKRGGVEDSRFVVVPSTADTSFMESMVMYEGGKSLLKYSK